MESKLSAFQEDEIYLKNRKKKSPYEKAKK
jgi:hypothetical protein